MYLQVLLCAVAILACKTSGDEGARQGPPELQIVSAGDEPRRTLRYQATKGTHQKIEVAVDMEVTAGDMGGPMPTLVMSLTLVVDSVHPTGGVTLRTTVVDVAARERDESRVPANALSGPLDAMKGTVIVATMLPSGRMMNSKVETSGKQMTEIVRTQLAALTTSFDQLMMPLPDEPVGVGAVWRNSKALEQSGMKMTAVNSVHLTAIDGDKLSFELDTEIHGDDQTVKQDDLAIEIKDITGTGAGKGSIDLRTLALTSELASELRSTMRAPGETEPTPMKMTIVTTAAPR